MSSPPEWAHSMKFLPSRLYAASPAWDWLRTRDSPGHLGAHVEQQGCGRWDSEGSGDSPGSGASLHVLQSPLRALHACDWGHSLQGSICFGFLSNGTNHFTQEKPHPVPMSWNQDLYFFNPHPRIYLLILEGEEGRVREREAETETETDRHQSDCLMNMSHQGWKLQPFGVQTTNSVRQPVLTNSATWPGHALFLEESECNLY